MIIGWVLQMDYVQSENWSGPGNLNSSHTFFGLLLRIFSLTLTLSLTMRASPMLHAILLEIDRYVTGANQR
jgi:hypothetical protein